MDYSLKMQMVEPEKNTYMSTSHLVTGLLQLIGSIIVFIYGILLLTVRYEIASYRNHWDDFSAGVWTGVMLFTAALYGLRASRNKCAIKPYLVTSVLAGMACVACCTFSVISGADNIHRLKYQPGYIEIGADNEDGMSMIKLCFNMTLCVATFMELCVCIIASSFSIRKLKSSF